MILIYFQIKIFSINLLIHALSYSVFKYFRLNIYFNRNEELCRTKIWMTSLKGHVCNSNIPEETLNPILKSLARTPSLLLPSLFHFNYRFLSSISTASLSSHMN